MVGSYLAERISDEYARRCDHQAAHQRCQHYFHANLFSRAVETVRANRPDGRIPTKVVDEARDLCRALYTPLSEVIDRDIARQAQRGRTRSETSFAEAGTQC